MVYTIRRPNTTKQNNTAYNNRKTYKEISDFIPCYEDSYTVGYKQYTKPLSNEKIYVNFYDTNKKFIIRRLSSLDTQAFYEKFGAYAIS